MTKPPRGIQIITRVNADKSISVKYRVRISRKDFKGKRNNYFDDINEAQSFLQLSKLAKGKELIYSITEEERINNRIETRLENNENYSLGYFVDLYLKKYVFNRTATTELIRRNQAMKKAFLTKICKISIIDRHLTYSEKEEMGIEHEKDVYRYFGAFDIRTEIKPIDINNYIESRLKGSKDYPPIKPISVVREITFISNVFNKLRYLDENLHSVKNPTREYDKSLLQNFINIRKRILTPEEELKFLEVVNNYSNPQMANICKISLLTSMRKSEVIFLRKSQIRENFKYIHLPITKSGKSRDVYLDEIAKQFLMNLQPAEKAKEDRYFTYSSTGFGKVFSELMLKNGMESIHYHDLRRTKVSRMLSLGGQDNTILIAKILGFQSVRKFEEIHLTNKHRGLSTQNEMLASNGHGSIDVAHKHYFNLVFTEIDKMERIKALKAKRTIEVLNNDEKEELLNLIFELQDS